MYETRDEHARVNCRYRRIGTGTSRSRRIRSAGFSIATLLVSINIAVVDRAARVLSMKIFLRVVGPLFVAVGPTFQNCCVFFNTFQHLAPV
jgi:hypothetical protein